ncbi:MAG: enolase C-terminal domain-like protein [Allomuricauda sp.]
MRTIVIKKVFSSDRRFKLKQGEGSDAIHSTSEYAYAVCNLSTDQSLLGVGLAFTLGKGNNLVCQAIDYLGKHIEGREINALMDNYGQMYQQIMDDTGLRWLGPHKGVVHLALAAITNACYDLWAKSKEVPLWKLLLDLSPEQLVRTLDFSYIEEELNANEAVAMLNEAVASRSKREGVLSKGYKGYDTSVGWFNYDDETIKANTVRALENGFTALKLKVGSKDASRDIRRAKLIRKVAGDYVTIMLDANQQWNLPKALEICKELSSINPYWIEEPTHPDDVFAHQELAAAIHPIKLAMGEHIPNKVIFKNFIKSGAMHFNQVDAVRVGGVSEFITISLLSKKYNIPIVPHVGDMGQIHQHLVLFNHVAMGHEALFLEHIPHLKDYFVHPVTIKNGHYLVPDTPGMCSDLKM